MRHDYDQFLEEGISKYNRKEKNIQVTPIKRPSGKVLTLSVWLCQGRVDQDTGCYETEYHLTLEEIDDLIEKLRAIQGLSKEHDRSKA